MPLLGKNGFDNPAVLIQTGTKTFDFYGNLTVHGSLQSDGSSSGTFIADGASNVTVANPAIKATSIVSFSLNTVGGTVGAIPRVTTITPGTGFTVAGSASDTSTYNYVIN